MRTYSAGSAVRSVLVAITRLRETASMSFADVVATLSPAVPMITADISAAAATPGETVQLAGGMLQSKGTGFCVDESGIVATAAHVVPASAQNIQATFPNGQTYTAAAK